MKLSYYIPGGFYIRNKFNSHRIGLGHQYGRRFIVSELSTNLRWKRRHVLDNTSNCSFNTKSIRKINFQRTKTLYQNNLKHIAFFFTFFKE